MSSLKFKMEASRACEIARNLLYNFTGANKSVYNNKFPYNCAYNGRYSTGTYISGDCWNMFPKCLYWGEAIGTPIDLWRSEGSYISPEAGTEKTGLPDCVGDVIINSYCSGSKSQDFSIDLLPGELLLIPNQHMGIYVGEYGEWTYEGKFYNVIEFTDNRYIGSGCRPSYVDSKGRRFSIDGTQSGAWSYHAKFDGFDYREEKKTLPDLYDLLEGLADYKIFPEIGQNDKYIAVNLWIQKALDYIGFYSGILDGIYGGKTSEACRLFQVNSGLESTGRFSSKDLAVLLDKLYKED